MLDLDVIAEWDEWLVVEPTRDRQVTRAREWLAEGSGTVVIWRKLDRVLPEKRPEGGWARRRMHGHGGQDRRASGNRVPPISRRRQRPRACDHGERGKSRSRGILSPRASLSRVELAPQRFEVVVGDVAGTVTLQRFILPSRDQFSSPVQFERLSGPLNWNRQQGLYIYRAGRLVQWGGWNGVRGIDEHTKLARASLEFDTDLDSVFNINVAKMRVTIPPQLRQMLERPINELCGEADDAYRKTSRRIAAVERSETGTGRSRPPWAGPEPMAGALDEDAGLALRAAAMQAGEYEAFRRIVRRLQQQAPDVAAALGLRSVNSGSVTVQNSIASRCVSACELRQSRASGH